MNPRRLATLLAAALLTATLAACSDDEGKTGTMGDPSPQTSDSVPDDAGDGLTIPDIDSTELDPAESTPVEDSYYPDIGDPRVDSLHHSLDLAWDPDSSTLDGTDTLIFRAAKDSEDFQLDLGAPLEVSSATLDGKEVETSHDGDILTIKAAIETDQRYQLVIDYSGTPEPTEAPTTRSDFSTTGWTIGDDGSVWTMQEPHGAFTWYPVNDQPADKALYDFRITVPEGWSGVANGVLTGEETIDGKNVMTWELDSPASSYLTTIAIGEMDRSGAETDSGVPITYWVPAGDTAAMNALDVVPDAFTWAEKYLGEYPFESSGWVVVDSESAMETQTMITLGNTEYSLSPNVIVHELVHHWYGNIVSPTDWRDVWMNEGMTMYLEANYEAETTSRDIDDLMDDWALYERGMRRQSGPPGDYDPDTFAEGNIYYGPALMWHELRKKLGDDEFWAMVKKWPTVEPEGNATRAEYLDWIEQETGEELTAFFDDWLLGKKTPKRK